MQPFAEKCHGPNPGHRNHHQSQIPWAFGSESHGPSASTGQLLLPPQCTQVNLQRLAPWRVHLCVWPWDLSRCSQVLLACFPCCRRRTSHEVIQVVCGGGGRVSGIRMFAYQQWATEISSSRNLIFSRSKNCGEVPEGGGRGHRCNTAFPFGPGGVSPPPPHTRTSRSCVWPSPAPVHGGGGRGGIMDGGFEISACCAARPKSGSHLRFDVQAGFDVCWVCHRCAFAQRPVRLQVAI